ncbi:MAG TPA: DUF3667 domain-containing protein [Casimicrobiaceae bacterium]|nr:DUF3667 domain-containing protein [Casimicrobiaceae bacterium]
MSAVEPAPAAATASSEIEAARCRNCRAPIAGRFCENCGQETDLRLPTLREFAREAAGRYVAFDGRFWRTLFALVFRPGCLTREYFAGRRRRYIRPARLYLFATLVFFAVSRFYVEPAEVINLMSDSPPAAAGKAVAKADHPKDASGAERGPDVDEDLDLELPADLPGGPALKNRWQRFQHQSLSEKTDQIVDGMLRYGPYAMFALVPAFALLLKLAYLGRHKRYPHRPRLFGEHLVFAAHNHAFFFVAATAALLAPAKLLRAIVFGWIVFYLFRSLRTVYGGSRIGVFLRASLLFISYSVLVGLATAGLVVAAVLLR